SACGLLISKPCSRMRAAILVWISCRHLRLIQSGLSLKGTGSDTGGPCSAESGAASDSERKALNGSLRGGNVGWAGTDVCRTEKAAAMAWVTDWVTTSATSLVMNAWSDVGLSAKARSGTVGACASGPLGMTCFGNRNCSWQLFWIYSDRSVSAW